MEFSFFLAQRIKGFALGEAKKATPSLKKLADSGIIRIFGEKEMILPCSRRHNRDRTFRKSHCLIPEDISMVMKALL
jgi:hypothetical protein